MLYVNNFFIETDREELTAYLVSTRLLLKSTIIKCTNLHISLINIVNRTVKSYILGLI